jgi:hypothetical protein
MGIVCLLAKKKEQQETKKKETRGGIQGSRGVDGDISNNTLECK